MPLSITWKKSRLVAPTTTTDDIYFRTSKLLNKKKEYKGGRFISSTKPFSLFFSQIFEWRFSWKYLVSLLFLIISVPWMKSWLCENQAHSCMPRYIGISIVLPNISMILQCFLIVVCKIVKPSQFMICLGTIMISLLVL